MKIINNNNKDLNLIRIVVNYLVDRAVLERKKC